MNNADTPRRERADQTPRLKRYCASLAAILILSATLAPLAMANAPRLVNAARQQTTTRVVYDGTYTRIAYPMGDVPADRGVCTDVVIRAYRSIGIDLQVLVHEDMRAHFAAYPRHWGLRAPDRNIDHRRVPNLQTFLARAGARLVGAHTRTEFRAGDLVTWMLPGNLPHIGIVSDRRTADGARPLVIHNIGAGPVEDDSLHAHPITGHFRYSVR